MSNESLQYLRNSCTLMPSEKMISASPDRKSPHLSRYSKKKRPNLNTLDSLTLAVQKPCMPSSPRPFSSALLKGDQPRTDLVRPDTMSRVASPRTGQAGDSLALLEMGKPCTNGQSPSPRGRRLVSKSKVHQLVVSIDASSDGGSARCATPSPGRILANVSKESKSIPQTTRHPIGRPVTPRDVLTPPAVPPTVKPVSVLEACQTKPDEAQLLSVHGSVESPQRRTLELHT